MVIWALVKFWHSEAADRPVSVFLSLLKHSIEGSLPLALLVEARGLVLVSVNEVFSHPLPPQIMP